MPRDTRMSRLLHMLIHMERHLERPSSEQLSKILNTNPVVVRRMMSGLRKGGIVAAERGQNGGWRLLKDLDHISLLDIYRALDEPTIFNIGTAVDSTTCLVEKAVDANLQNTLDAAEMLILERFDRIKVSEIRDEFLERLSKVQTEIS